MQIADFFQTNLPPRSELRDVARLALQSATAAAASYLLLRALGLPEVFVGVISAVLIVKPSLGSTMGSGMQRVFATLVGCVIGVATMWAIPYGYSTALALAISMLVMNAIAGFKREWRYGVVAAVALSLGAEADLVQAATDRALSIGIGAAVGILTSITVWPDHATSRAHRRLAAAMLVLFRALRDGGNDDADRHWIADYRAAIADVNTLIANIRVAENGDLARQRDALEQLAVAVTLFTHVVHADPLHRDDAEECKVLLGAIRDAAGNSAARIEATIRSMNGTDDAIRKAIGEICHAVDGPRTDDGHQSETGHAAFDLALSELTSAFQDLDAAMNLADVPRASGS